MTVTNKIATNHLEEATRQLDPIVIIMNEFTDSLEKEAVGANKNPAYTSHFVHRVLENYIPVFNLICSSIIDIHGEVLAANQSLYSVAPVPHKDSALPGNDR